MMLVGSCMTRCSQQVSGWLADAGGRVIAFKTLPQKRSSAGEPLVRRAT